MTSCCTSNAPKLNNRVEVWCLKSGLTLSGGGHANKIDDTNWRPLGREWVDFKTRGSREFFRGDAIAADITHQITMRWSRRAEQYTKDMRIKFGDKVFHIAAPPANTDERNEYLVFPATQIV